MTTTHGHEYFTISDIVNHQYKRLRFSYEYTEDEAKKIFAETYNPKTVEIDQQTRDVNKPLKNKH
jgi:hypothetical protein